MADETEVHIGENSPEQVALKLMSKILLKPERKDEILDTYAECLATVRLPFERSETKKRVHVGGAPKVIG